MSNTMKKIKIYFRIGTSVIALMISIFAFSVSSANAAKSDYSLAMDWFSETFLSGFTAKEQLAINKANALHSRLIKELIVKAYKWKQQASYRTVAILTMAWPVWYEGRYVLRFIGASYPGWNEQQKKIIKINNRILIGLETIIGPEKEGTTHFHHPDTFLLKETQDHKKAYSAMTISRAWGACNACAEELRSQNFRPGTP